MKALRTPRRRLLAIALAGLGLGFPAADAHAAELFTTSYSESAGMFEWFVHWTGIADAPSVEELSWPSEAVFWTGYVRPVLRGGTTWNDLVFRGRHRIGPDGGEDVAHQGARGEFGVRNANTLAPSATFIPIPSAALFRRIDITDHQSHTDWYFLEYRTAEGGGYDFRFSGEHRTDTVPEPASMILLGSGLAGLAGAARRRRARSDSPVG